MENERDSVVEDVGLEETVGVVVADPDGDAEHEMVRDGVPVGVILGVYV